MIRDLCTSFLVLLTLSLLSSTASALIIDDFEDGAFSDTGVFFLEQSVSAGVVGGVRLRGAGPLGANHAFDLTLSAGDDGVVVQNNGAGFGSTNFIYDGQNDGGFGGTSGGLSLDLSGLSEIRILIASVTGTPELQLGLYSSGAFQTPTSQPLVAGINTVPLSSFGLVDLTDVRAMQFFAGLDGGEGYQLMDIRVVPEVGTAMLLGLGLAFGLGATRSGARR